MKFRTFEKEFRNKVNKAKEILQQERKEFQQNQNVKAALQKHKETFHEGPLIPTIRNCLETMQQLAKDAKNLDLHEKYEDNKIKWQKLLFIIDKTVCLELQLLPEEWKDYNKKLKDFTETTASVQNVVTQVQKQTEDLSNQEYLCLEFQYEEIVKNMGKLSDDSKWLNEYFIKLLQKSFHPSKEHKQESSTGLSLNSLELQPIRNKGTDESTFFTNDDSNPMKKHSSWVNKTQGLVNEDLSNGDMTGCQQGHEENATKNCCVSEPTNQSVEMAQVEDIPKLRLIVSFESQPLKYGNTVILEALIDSRSKRLSVEWKKDATSEKEFCERISKDHSDKYHPKLVIRHVTLSDSGKYSVIVSNSKGHATDFTQIEIEENHTVFLVGPTVVSPSEAIYFKAIYPLTSKKNLDDAKWFKSGSSTAIDFIASGYHILTSIGESIFQRVKIPYDEENGGVYRIIVNSKESNSIDVSLDDSTERNCMSFFALLNVGAKAMRMKIGRHPENLQTIWKRFEKKCTKQNKKYKSDTPPSSWDDIDISTMHALVRKCVKLKPPSKGWEEKPNFNDKSTAADIKRIQFYRNQICHSSSFEMNPQNFNEDASDVIGAIQRLSDENDQLKKEICEILNRKIARGNVFKEMEKLNRFVKKIKEEDVAIEESGIMHTRDYAFECSEEHEDTPDIPKTQCSTSVGTLIVTERPESSEPVTVDSDHMCSYASSISSKKEVSETSNADSTQIQKPKVPRKTEEDVLQLQYTVLEKNLERIRILQSNYGRAKKKKETFADEATTGSVSSNKGISRPSSAIDTQNKETKSTKWTKEDVNQLQYTVLHEELKKIKLQIELLKVKINKAKKNGQLPISKTSSGSVSCSDGISGPSDTSAALNKMTEATKKTEGDILQLKYTVLEKELEKNNLEIEFHRANNDSS